MKHLHVFSSPIPHRAGLWALQCALLLFTCIANSESTGSLADLQKKLADQIAAPHFTGAMWGVKVVSLDSGKTLFEHNAAKLLSPASNCKLYPVAAALDRLGADYRIRTSLYSQAKPDETGTLGGDLIVYGRGAPDFNARLYKGDIHRAFASLVAALTNAGIKRISGDLVGDESFFRGSPIGSGWAWDDAQYYYGAEISALTANDNYLEVAIAPGDHAGDPCKLTLSPAPGFVVLSNRTETAAADARTNITLYRPPGVNVTYVMGRMPLGSKGVKEEVTVHNPALLFVTFFREALERHGIQVGGRVRTVNWLDRGVQPLDHSKLVELGSVESLPLREIAAEIQKPSQNLYTDLLLAHLGEVQRQKESRVSNESSEESGVRVLRAFVERAGVAREDFHFEEGSGLSRNNLTTPNATLALLRFMDTHAEAATYRKALPVAGVDGTLRSRLRGTPAEGNVQAKTGTLRWANSLSGYLKTAVGERLVFCIMLNRYDAPDDARSARREIDRMVLELVALKEK
jgi:D-alanyl-D-alanine carboxypeptidase/D-alanyl-D-alanine-endopeptidase (penicillin-binding protein 4)